MRPFMDYVQAAYWDASRWDTDNFYSAILRSSRALLYFDIPRGLRFHVSGLSSPHSASSYELGSTGLITGSLSYLSSSLPLYAISKSSDVQLRDVAEGYRHVSELQRSEVVQAGFARRRAAFERKDTLLYGRLYLPQSTLEALYMRRISPTREVRVSCVSDARLENGGTVLATVQQDCGKYSTEYLYSTDSALLGVRGLYNFGYDPRDKTTIAPASVETGGLAENANASAISGTSEREQEDERRNGRLSVGGELYYGLLNKSGGASAGLRFTTLPRHAGFPYTMTVTLNPLMGSLSSTYAVKAGRHVALCSQFDFNFFSYESGIKMGAELWRAGVPASETEWARRIRDNNDTSTYNGTGSGASGSEASMWRSAEALRPANDAAGVLRARWDQNWKIGLLWEGRFKELLFAVGVGLDMRRREQVFDAVGVELQFSS